MRLQRLVFICPPTVQDPNGIAGIVSMVSPRLSGRVMLVHQPHVDGFVDGRQICWALGITWLELRKILGDPNPSAAKDRAILDLLTRGRATDMLVLVVSPAFVARLGQRISVACFPGEGNYPIPTLHHGQSCIIH